MYFPIASFTAKLFPHANPIFSLFGIKLISGNSEVMASTEPSDESLSKTIISKSY